MDWQDLNLRPLVPNDRAALTYLERSAIFITSDDVRSRSGVGLLWRSFGGAGIELPGALLGFLRIVCRLRTDANHGFAALERDDDSLLR
jgi:hypothetical protein